MEKNGAVDAFHLVKEEDHSKIVAVLKKRLPYSGNVSKPIVINYQ